MRASASVHRIDVEEVVLTMTEFIEQRKRRQYAAAPSMLRTYRYRVQCVDCGYAVIFEEQQ